MTDLVLWRRLTETDFRAMRGEASPGGHGGGAMHIALGVDSARFPVRQFLRTSKAKTTIATEPWLGHHKAATLTLSGAPTRRGGEWRIADQYSHRHPAWAKEAGFPASYNTSDSPVVLLFQVSGRYHVRFSTTSKLAAPGVYAPKNVRSQRKGISSVSPGLLRAFGIRVKTRLDQYEDEADTIPEETFNPANIEDGRKRVFAQVKRRQGQQAFRRALFRAYEERCAITGCDSLWVLEAAHISPYRGTATNKLVNGILLRADVHTLFDLGLISIEPETLIIRVSSQLEDSEYARFDGRKLLVPTEARSRPNLEALQQHYAGFQP